LKNTVVPAQAGTHFDLRYEISSHEIQMDPGFRRDDEVGIPGVIVGLKQAPFLVAGKVPASARRPY